jgi:CCR4-NOT transcription complex subunit 7/8
MEDFGELLTTSGLIVDSKITWLTFHSCFDFGYLIKSILNGHLPNDEKEFFRYYKAFFPKSYDIKMLMKEPGPAGKLKGGLQDVADTLQVTRIGRRHQAGSDALLTARTFFKIKEIFFADNWNEVKFEKNLKNQCNNRFFRKKFKKVCVLQRKHERKFKISNVIFSKTTTFQNMP